MRLVNKDAMGSPFPDGTERWTYQSGVDGQPDRALLRPGSSRTWFVVLHGHGSHEDQIFSRQDLREHWLPAILTCGGGLLAPNLRDDAWMSPAAVRDLHALLAAVRTAYGATRFLFFSGSMGGTGNLIYALHHPEDVAACAALGAAPDPAAYVGWLSSFSGNTIQGRIRAAIASAYGGPPDARPSPYAERDAAARAFRLTMPVFLCHGAADTLMPVAGSRRLARALAHHPGFRYLEIEGGHHDSPLFRPEALSWILAQYRAGERETP